MAARGDKNIGGLDVAMNDPLAWAVSRASAISMARVRDVSVSSGRPDNFVFESGAFQALHGDEGAALMLADVVDGANIGMIQG